MGRSKPTLPVMLWLRVTIKSNETQYIGEFPTLVSDRTYTMHLRFETRKFLYWVDSNNYMKYIYEDSQRGGTPAPWPDSWVSATRRDCPELMRHLSDLYETGPYAVKLRVVKRVSAKMKAEFEERVKVAKVTHAMMKGIA